MIYGTHRTRKAVCGRIPKCCTAAADPGFQVSQMIYVAAKLDIADLVAGGAKSVDEIAAASETHAPSLYRLLRALASQGIFAEDSRVDLG